jgi:hypothetical protein
MAPTAELSKKLNDILVRVWGLPSSAPFQNPPSEQHPNAPRLCLRDMGGKLDGNGYETLDSFAADARTVFSGCSSYYGGEGADDFLAQQASDALRLFEGIMREVAVQQQQAAVSISHANLQTTNETNTVSTSSSTPGNPLKKRKVTEAGASSSTPPPSQSHKSDKAAQGLKLLKEYVVECGGNADDLEGWYVTIESRKDGKTQGSTDMYYMTEKGKKFRSRAEVARYFNLAAAPPKRTGGAKKKVLTYASERKRLSKEVEKLVEKRNKNEIKLKEMEEEELGKGKIVDDSELLSKQVYPEEAGKNLPGIRQEAMTDLLAVWDFLSTFSKTMLLTVTSIEEFAIAIARCEGEVGVFLAEAHVSMLRMLMGDEFSEAWWTLELLPGTQAEQDAAKAAEEAAKKAAAEAAAEKAAAKAKAKEDNMEGDDSDDSSDEESDDEMKEDESQGDNTAYDFEQDDTPKSRTLASLLLSSCEKPLKENILPINFPMFAGIVCERLLDYYAKRRIASDNEIREAKGYDLLTKEEVQERRANIAVRLFPPCSDGVNDPVNPLDRAIAHLSRGSSYVSLNAVQKILIMRLLMEALYETERIKTVVEDNNSQRYNAEKRLEDEQRQEAREEREAWSAMLQRAKENLVQKQKDDFCEERRQEWISANPDDPQLDLSYEQILEDEVTSAQCDASLSIPSKSEIMEAAQELKKKAELGEGDKINIVTLGQLNDIDLQSMRKLEEESTSSIYDLDDLDSSAVRDTLNRSEIAALKDLKYRRDVSRKKVEEYPEYRAEQITQLEEAVKMDSIPLLRSAIKSAKMYDLQGRTYTHEGYIEETLMNAVVALKAAEGRRRKNEAKKTLVQQRDACFVRTVPIGMDRKHRRFWVFPSDHPNRVWVEEICGVSGDSGIDVSLQSFEKADILDRGIMTEEEKVKFLKYSQQEYEGSSSSWSYFVTERSCRALLQQLDDRGIRERSLKENLKQAIENRARPVDTEDDDAAAWRMSGDAEALKQRSTELTSETSEKFVGRYDLAAVHSIVSESAINKRVRHRFDEGNYLMGTITGWVADGEVDDRKDVALWHVAYDAGEEEDWEASEVARGLLNAKRYIEGNGSYVDDDGGAVMYYKNSLGKFGANQGLKVSEMHRAMQPHGLAALLLKREAEIFPAMKEKAKRNTWGDDWGGRDGLRNSWLIGLKEGMKGESGEISLGIVKQALLNLEENMLLICSGHHEDLNEGGKLNLHEDFALNNLNVYSYAYMDEWGGTLNAETLWEGAGTRKTWLTVVDASEEPSVLACCLDVLVNNCKMCSLTRAGVGGARETKKTEEVMTGGTRGGGYRSYSGSNWN